MTIAAASPDTTSHSPVEVIHPGNAGRSADGTFVEVTHAKSDPGSWIVRRYTTMLWFRRRVSSHWFNNERQAIEFANALRAPNAHPPKI